MFCEFRVREKDIVVIYHGTHEKHESRPTHKENSGQFCVDHWTEATDASTKVLSEPASVLSALSATQKRTQGSLDTHYNPCPS